MRRWVFVVVAACALAGCNTTGDVASTMYPDAVRAGSSVKGDAAILVVGNGGSEFLMASKAVGDDADLKFVVSDFMKYASSKDEQVNMVETLKRLPGNAEAIADPIVTGDELLAGASAAAQNGIPQPTNLEMRCVFDSMTNGVREMYTGAKSDVAAIAAGMQSSAETCIAQQ